MTATSATPASPAGDRRHEGHGDSMSPRDLRKRGLVLLVGAAVIALLVKPVGPLGYHWNPLLVGVDFPRASGGGPARGSRTRPGPGPVGVVRPPLPPCRAGHHRGKGLLGGGQRHLQRPHDEQAGPADAQVEHVCRPTVEVQGERGVRGGREAEDRRVVQELPPAAGCGGVCTRPELRRRRSPPAPGGSLMQIGIVLGFLTGCPAVALLLERGTKVAV